MTTRVPRRQYGTVEWALVAIRSLEHRFFSFPGRAAHRVAREVVTQQTQVRTDVRAALEQQPHCHQEQRGSAHQGTQVSPNTPAWIFTTARLTSSVSVSWDYVLESL